MTPGRMLALAREGRLVMRVQSRDLANLPEIAAIENSKIDRSWRLTSNVPDQVVAAITPKAPTFVGPVPEHPVTIAGTNERASQPTLGAPSAKRPIEPEDPASRVKAKFLIDLPNTEKALNQIKLVFADRLKAGVVFEELDEPVKLPEAQDPETLLWWTLPPAQWVEHVTVPVVVEGEVAQGFRPVAGRLLLWQLIAAATVIAQPSRGLCSAYRFARPNTHGPLDKLQGAQLPDGVVQGRQRCRDTCRLGDSLSRDAVLYDSDGSGNGSPSPLSNLSTASLPVNPVQ